MPALILTLLFMLIAPSAGAEEFHGLGGMVQSFVSGERSYSWQLEYQESLGEHFAASLAYLNEGHLKLHHRDGQMAQLWTRTSLFNRRLTLGAGIGPFFYFDTVAAKSGASYANDHGWGLTTSLAATWYADSRLLVQARSNLTKTGSEEDTFSVLLGIGYQLSPPDRPGPLERPPQRTHKTTNNELTVFLGRTIVNSFNSEHSFATAVEYRHGLMQYLDWTLGWLYEGDNRLSRRNGLTTQLWGAKAFMDDRVALGFGAGAYINIDRYYNALRNNERRRYLSGLVTMSASYRLDPDWALRLSWNRIVTNYNSDTDVILGGLGYRF